jgi:hypothetical protein
VKGEFFPFSDLKYFDLKQDIGGGLIISVTNGQSPKLKGVPDFYRRRSVRLKRRGIVM